ncbi:hypothetical protein AMTR_s00013p00027010, partial [Amborella trichopoda]
RIRRRRCRIDRFVVVYESERGGRRRRIDDCACSIQRKIDGLVVVYESEQGGRRRKINDFA